MEGFPVTLATSGCFAQAGYYLFVSQFPHLKVKVVGLLGELNKT